MATLSLPSLPGPLTWHHEPTAWQAAPDGSLTLVAGSQTDYFHDPATGQRTACAPAALMAAEDASFILSARASLVGDSTFDAAVLFVRASDDLWAKFCLEISPAGVPTIVSVVTRGVSDDCNSVTLAAPEVWLRVAKTPRTVAFHYSLDASHWQLVRYFSLGELPTVQIGFVGQSPVGPGATARFAVIRYRVGELANLRDGQ